MFKQMLRSQTKISKSHSQKKVSVMLEEIELFVTIAELYYFSVCSLQNFKSCRDLELLVLMIKTDLALTDLERTDCSWN